MGVELFKRIPLLLQRDLDETLGRSGIVALEIDSEDDDRRRRGFKGDFSNGNRWGSSGVIGSLEIGMNRKRHC